MCRVHATVRGLLGEIVAGAEDVAVVDMEAGLEHLSRGTVRHVDTVLAVLEPYYRSLETGARVVELARELGIGRVLVVVNKVRDDADRHALDEFCRNRGLPLAAVIPHDPCVLEADRKGGSLLDHAPEAPSVGAIRELAEQLVGGSGGRAPVA
jgi:CO dehydrogenase maturation factor